MKEILIVFGSAVLAGLGVGSGGFYLLFLTTDGGLGQYEAQGVNLLFFVLATLSSSWLNLRRGRLPQACLPVLLTAGTAGTAAGAFFTLLVSPEAARILLGLFLIAGGVYALLTRKVHGKGANPLDKMH